MSEKMPTAEMCERIDRLLHDAEHAHYGADFDDSEDATGRAKGGFARAEALSPQERQDIARRAALARWTADIPKATHEGPLQIRGAEGVVIPCAVLEDGTRLLSRIGFLRAIGRRGKAKGGRKYDQESQLPVFLTAENLKPFITNDLLENSKPVPFRPLKGSTAMGYRAELLPLVCNVFLDAREKGVLRPNQEHIADMCKILIRGFAVTGITALVDEATGYQEANLTWMVAQDTRENIWIANLPALGLTVTADTFGELPEAMKEALDLLFQSLFEDGELSQFMRTRGWKPLVQLPPQGTAVRFDVPFAIQRSAVRDLVAAPDGARLSRIHGSLTMLPTRARGPRDEREG